MAKATRKNLYLDKPSMHVDDYAKPVMDQIGDWMEDMGLIREYVRNMLTERKTQSKRMQAISNSITRKIMEIIKNGQTSGSRIIDRDEMTWDPDTDTDEIHYFYGGDLPLAFDPDNSDYTDIEKGLGITVEILRNSDELRISAYDKESISEYELGIHVVAELPTDFSSELSSIRKEIANSVRHELEHTTQGSASAQPGAAFGRGSDYFSVLYSEDDVSSSMAKYLLQPEEVSAHIRGYLQNNKTRSSFQNDVEDLLTVYVRKKLIDEEEKNKVLEAYLDWADRHVNTKKWRAS